MEVEIKTIDENDDLPIPEYMTKNSSGVDLRAAVKKSIVIEPSETKLIPTGISIKIPAGYEAQIRPRSGLALKYGITLLNSPGTIDADYRGEIKIILSNFGKKEFIVNRGDRIAQMVFVKIEKVNFKQVNELKETKRGSGGFGHTGI